MIGKVSKVAHPHKRQTQKTDLGLKCSDHISHEVYFSKEHFKLLELALNSYLYLCIFEISILNVYWAALKFVP